MKFSGKHLKELKPFKHYTLSFKLILPILRFVNWVIVIDGGFFLDDLGLCAGAGHGGAEEDVDEKHDAEEDGEGDAEPHQPVWVAGTPTDPGAIDGSSWKTIKLIKLSCNIPFTHSFFALRCVFWLPWFGQPMKVLSECIWILKTQM